MRLPNFRRTLAALLVPLASPLLITAAAAGGAAGVGAALLTRPARAQSVTDSLFISGMSIGPGRKAVVRIYNSSENFGDTVRVHYTIRETFSGGAISLPIAGDGAPVNGGRMLELDLGKIVAARRKQLGLGPFVGPVQFVAFGEGGVERHFTRDVIVVEARQSIGQATFDAPVQWN